MPIVTVMCIIGGYALNTRITDVFLLFIFGIIGYFLTEMGYHPAPIVLGVLLGGMIDNNLRRALMISDGSISPFLTRPISLVFILASIYIIISQMSLWRKIWQKQRKKIKFIINDHMYNISFFNYNYILYILDCPIWSRMGTYSNESGK